MDIQSGYMGKTVEEWRGHGGNFRYKKKKGWEFYQTCRALNQPFYAIFASEWHDNHHSFPNSSNCAFLPGQADLSFAVIKFLRFIGIISEFLDYSPHFKKRYNFD